MTPEQTIQLSTILRHERERAGLSIGEVARRAGVDVGTVWRIEQGKIGSPKAESLQAIGEVLRIPASDLYATVGWMPEGELPTIRPYLRTKYRQLPPEAVAEIEAEFDAIARRHGISFDSRGGPQNNEDE